MINPGSHDFNVTLGHPVAINGIISCLFLVIGERGGKPLAIHSIIIVIIIGEIIINSSNPHSGGRWWGHHTPTASAGCSPLPSYRV